MSIKTAYHSNIRRIISAVGSLFNNLSLVTYNSNGEEEKRVKVPLIYSPKEKFITKLYSDYDSTQKIGISLPRASYELTNMSYDANRKLQLTRTITKKSDKLHQRVPVPYDFNFDLTIYTRNIEDGYQIMESIVTYFNPDFNIIINDDPDFNSGRALPVVLNRVSQEIEYEGPSDSKTRLVSFIFNLTAKGYIYPPTEEYDVIREVIVNVKDMKRTERIFLKLEQNGDGDFIVGEKVYQGYSPELSESEGTVVEFDRKNMIVELEDVDGVFRSNSKLIGANSMAYYDVICGCNRKIDLIGQLPPDFKLWLDINIKPEPEDSEPEDEWDYNIKITEHE